VKVKKKSEGEERRVKGKKKIGGEEEE